MEKHQIETINDLLKYNGYPVAHIQGHHTRIIVDSDTGDFIVYGKARDGSYTINIYRGDNETAAVWSFIEHEED